MTPLDFGDKIKPGYIVLINEQGRKENIAKNVNRVDDKFAYVKVNRTSTIALPIIYDESFVTPDEEDTTTYKVFKP